MTHRNSGRGADAFAQPSLEGFEPPARPTDSFFFAIYPDSSTAGRIAQLARRLRAEHDLQGTPLATERFHITLHHLGDYAGVPKHIADSAHQAASAVAMPSFDVAFDSASSFANRSAKRPFVLRGGEGVGALMAFQQAVGMAMKRVGLGDWAQDNYTPHVTLLYDDRVVAPQPVDPVTWTVHEFVLVHSLLGQGVHIPLARWSLRG